MVVFWFILNFVIHQEDDWRTIDSVHHIFDGLSFIYHNKLMSHEQHCIFLYIINQRVMILLNEFLDKMNVFEGILACPA